MPFQPDLADTVSLAPDAPFPAAIQGEWLWPESGGTGLVVEGRTLRADRELMVHDLFLREGDGWTMVLNTLSDPGRLPDGWEDETIYLLALDPDGGLMVCGRGDPANLVRREAVDWAKVRPPRWPFIDLPQGADLPEAFQGEWRGEWQGQRLAFRGAGVIVDGAALPYLHARLIDLVPVEGGPVASLVLDLADGGTLNVQLFAGGQMQGAGAPLRETLFRRLP
ncbi:hypothetical protein [Aurantiacibacter luteus]|uniref:Uncharacterized protein n=1 Tax=Aurantiacibacter luteus TaxID=1581420 RepID=A0A0G9MNW6_9SPHN|nr:hypothetical protein [Aurantiacibacter luteus]KLE32412.1 hypothetical protein AAW00_13325 [Aurantiacibacter luteus]